MRIASKFLTAIGALALCYSFAILFLDRSMLPSVWAQGSPGADYGCNTYSTGLGSQFPCRCPVGSGGSGEVIDWCNNARPHPNPTQDGQFQVDGDTIYLPECGAEPGGNCVSSPPAVPCGTTIWQCAGICCDGSCSGGNPNGCHSTSKPPGGCTDIYYGCAGAYQ